MAAFAVATVLIVPADEARRSRHPCARRVFPRRGSASPPGTGFAVVRLCAADGAALRHDLVAVLTAVHNGSFAAAVVELT